MIYVTAKPILIVVRDGFEPVHLHILHEVSRWLPRKVRRHRDTRASLPAMEK